MTETLRIALLTRREVRPTCSFPIAKQSTFPAVTWPSAGAGWRPSMDLIRNSGKLVTTWIFAGERESEAENSGSVRRPWSGITIAGPCGRIGNNRWATARPRLCSRESGRKSTIPVATQRGQDTYMSTEYSAHFRCRAGGFIRELGEQQVMRDCTSLHRTF